MKRHKMTSFGYRLSSEDIDNGLEELNQTLYDADKLTSASPGLCCCYTGSHRQQENCHNQESKPEAN
jgi:hypothetical protein